MSTNAPEVVTPTDDKSNQGEPNNEDILQKMVSHGLAEGTPDGENPNPPADASNGGNPPAETVKIGDSEYKLEDLKAVLGKVGNLEETIKSLQSSDTAINRQLMEKLNAYLDKSANPEPTPERVPTQEEIQSFKKSFDEKAAEDYTGATLELASSVVRTSIKPLLDRISELEKKLDGVSSNLTKSSQEENNRRQAFTRVEKAFQENGAKVDATVWNKAVSFYKDNFGIDLISQVYSNPTAFSKQIGLFLKNYSGKSAPTLNGLPAGPGSGSGNPDDKQKTSKEKVEAKMKGFGLSR